MNRKAAFLSLSAALVLGIAGDVLLRWVPWGINVPLWVALFAGTVIALTLKYRPQAAGGLWLPAIGAMCGAVGISWRASDTLIGLDLLLLAIFLPMLAIGAREVRVAASGLMEIAAANVMSMLQSITGVFQLVLQDVEWKSLPKGTAHRGLGVFLRGLLLALPLLIVFGALLSAADARFSKLLSDIFRFNLAEGVAHVFVTAILAAACAGFLRSVLASGPMPRPERPSWLRVPAGETNVALALVDILFALFVAVQFRYFFLEQSPASLSEYARRGFFELVWVVFLVLPLLLAAEWLLDKTNPRAVRLFRILAGAQIALVFVIAASAYRRMQLYRDEFGLTELRFYTTAFMIFLAVLLVLFAATVLTGRRERFAAGALAAAIVAVVTLHAINPDERIVATNIARDRAGERVLDTIYAFRLSDDSIPVVMQNLDLFAGSPCQIGFLGVRRYSADWRTWNHSRDKAQESIVRNLEELRRMRGECRARRDASRYESKATPPIGRP